MDLYNEALGASVRLKFQFPYDIGEWINEKNMVMENYHKHTTWSDLVQIDSATNMIDFIRHSEKMGGQCYFSGEHGYQGEWVYAYDVCKNTETEKFREGNTIERPIKFRYSTEAYWVKDRIKEVPEIDKDTGEYKRDKKTGEIKKSRDRTNCHIVLVARTYQAMRKLNYIISEAHSSGFYGKPRIDLDLLFSLTPDDVYVTSACLAGWKYEDATEIWYRIWKHFGNSFFLEYQTHNTAAQRELNQRIYQMSQEFGIQTIIGLDTHYISEEDRIKRDNLLKRKKITYDDEEGWYMDYPDGKTVYDRMKEQQILPDQEILYAMMNTQVFLDGCEDVQLDTQFKIPVLQQYQNFSYEERSSILLDKLKGYFKKEDPDIQTQDRYDGMMYEYGEIEGSGTADYFLDNNALVDLAVHKYGGQLTTTSRGSASSYYCSKLLGFTTMDRFESEVPIYPERFITKDRILSSHQMPDIDLNVASQEPFVQAARELCGEHGCYPLLAVGKLGEKSGFKLYAGVKGVEPSIANDISKCIDRYNEALKQVDDEEDKKDIHIEDYIENADLLRIFNESKPYQDIIEQAKVHACGFMLFNGNPRETDVVGYGDIRYEIGLIRCHSESTGKSTIVVNIEGNLLDAYGYVKDDFLIVDVVGIIYKLYHGIGREVPPVRALRKMVENDAKTWDLYANGITCCLNQCEKASTTKKVMRYKPQNIKELSAFIAGIRPGFKSLLEGFLRREPYSNGEPVIDDLLKDCFHYMLYQEAVMKIFSWLGIPMKESYDTIKKISKKKLKGEALKHVEDTLREHWKADIGNLDNFEPVYKVIKDSARYSFNAPHALAMANDSLYEAWMKGHYTSTFYEITLNHYQAKGDKNKVNELLQEARHYFGYSLGHYEYGKDNTQFTVDDEAKIIYPNLASVKGIGEKAVTTMVQFARDGIDDFIDIYLAIKGTQVNATIFKNLVKIQYFKKFGSVKKLLKIIEVLDEWKGSDGRGKKTLKKSAAALSISSDIDIKHYGTDQLASGKTSTKEWKIFDWKGLARDICSRLPDEEFPSYVLAAMGYSVLGYIDYYDPSLPWQYVVVCDLDTTYSPKFQGYSVAKGTAVELKIHKTKPTSKYGNNQDVVVSFADIPLKDGDVIYINKIKKQQRQRKIDGKWTPIEGEYDWWIKDYYKVVSSGD